MNVTVPDGVTAKGRPIYLDADGYREFSPRTIKVLRYISAVVLPAVALLAVLLATGVIPPAPWSPLGLETRTPPDAPTLLPTAPAAEPSSPAVTV